MKRFANRVAIVTGAAQGIGAAIARRLGQEGATVVVADINEPAAAKIAAECANNSFAAEIPSRDLIRKRRQRTATVAIRARLPATMKSCWLGKCRRIISPANKGPTIAPIRPIPKHQPTPVERR